MTLGEKITDLRYKSGMTQKQLAKKAGICQNSLARYEHDINEPSVFAVSWIAGALNTSIDFLMGDEVEQPPEIVRCKDCKYSIRQGPDNYVCSKCMCGMSKGKDFCSKGEKK